MEELKWAHLLCEGERRVYGADHLDRALLARLARSVEQQGLHARGSLTQVVQVVLNRHNHVHVGVAACRAASLAPRHVFAARTAGRGEAAFKLPAAGRGPSACLKNHNVQCYTVGS